MRRTLSFLIAVVGIAALLVAPLSALALHRDCIRQQSCGRHAVLANRCCSLSSTEKVQPGIMTTTPGLESAGDAVLFVPVGHVSMTRMMRTIFLDTSPPGQPARDLPTLFRTLLI